MSRVTFASLALALPFAAACTINTPATTTTGTMGKLTFQYEQDDCLLFCGESLSTPVLAGAGVDLQVTGGDPFTQFSAQVSPAGLADATMTESCTCANSSTSRVVGIADTCASAETKSCIESVTVSTHGVGDVTLQILGPSGVVDQTTLHLEAATSIQATVASNGVPLQPDGAGVYTVKQGQPVSISSSATGAGGQTLVFTRGAFLFTYLDPAVLASDPPLIGSATLEMALAVAPGQALLNEQAGVGVTRSLSFNVTP